MTYAQHKRNYIQVPINGEEPGSKMSQDAFEVTKAQKAKYPRQMRQKWERKGARGDRGIGCWREFRRTRWDVFLGRVVK